MRNLENILFWLILLVSVIFSIGSVAIGIIVPIWAKDANRGGALGTALALAVLFVNRNYGFKLFNALVNEIPELLARIAQQPDADNTQLVVPTQSQRLDALLKALKMEGEIHTTETTFLVVASVVGTIAWGFGDMIACKWTTGYCHCP